MHQALKQMIVETDKIGLTHQCIIKKWKEDEELFPSWKMWFKKILNN